MNSESRLVFPGCKLSDIIASVKPWVSHNDHKSYDVDGHRYEYVEDVPLEKRMVYGLLEKLNGERIDFEVKLNQNLPNFKDIFYHIGRRDNLSINIIEWQDCYLVVLHNSVRLSGTWLTKVTKAEVDVLVQDLKGRMGA